MMTEILSTLHVTLVIIQRVISAVGVGIILIGVLTALYHYLADLFSSHSQGHSTRINNIRMSLGRNLILGLEFIVASDLIGTTTTPDYYAVGLAVIIVLIRTVLSFSLNRELLMLSKEK